MLEKVTGFVKGLFVKEDGGINWKTIIMVGAGAALGGFGALPFLGEGAGAALAAGGIGLGVSAATNLLGGSPVSASEIMTAMRSPTTPGQTGAQPGAAPAPTVLPTGPGPIPPAPRVTPGPGAGR